MDKDKKFVGGWWIWIGCLLVLTTIVGAGLKSAGLIGGTIVEREVFENSFQYSESRKTQIATFEAQLAEIERKLMNSDLDQTTRHNLEAQASSLRIQLATARSM